jgi:alkaline phosphatase D
MLDRRGLLKGALGVGVAGIATPALLGGPAHAQFKSDPFTLGVASGDPGSDGFVIWTRLAPQPMQMRGGVGGPRQDVTWEVGADSQMKQIVRSGTATAHVELGFSVHVEIAGLEPAREYFYRFRAGGVESPIGRSRTFPAPGSEVGELKFAAAGCQQWEGGFYTAWRRIAEENLDFVFHYGDYIYEFRAFDSYRDGSKPPRAMPADFPICINLLDYRRRYALYKSDSDLQAAHASCPFLASFDDHEVANDWASDTDPPNTPAEAFLMRRAAAFQAWYEHMPVRRSQIPRGPDTIAYRRLRFGNLADVAVLDTRQYRSKQPCGNGVKACADADAPDRTMLGVTQERWLAEQLKGDQATWQVLAQQVLFATLDWRSFPWVTPSESPAHALDKWDGATAGRDRVLGMLRESKALNPIVLTGDLHIALALEISEKARNASPSPIAVEFVSTSISSGGDGSPTVANAETLYRNNSHLKFASTERGYCRHVVTPKRWQADYRVVEKVSVAGSPIKTRKSFVVEAGKPGLVEG